jgi:hypothetical protein
MGNSFTGPGVSGKLIITRRGRAGTITIKKGERSEPVSIPSVVIVWFVDETYFLEPGTEFATCR